MKIVKNMIPYIVAAVICLLVSISIPSNSIDLDEAYSLNLISGGNKL